MLAAKKESPMFATLGYLTLGMLSFAGIYLLTHALERM
jgi:hypothetical protein